MTPIHLIGITYALPIPEDASAIVSHVAGGTQKIVFSSKIQDPAQCGGDMITLPQGNWQIICTTKECTEEQAADIVDPMDCGYMNVYKCYNKNIAAGADFFWRAKDSLDNLLASKGLDINKNYVLIRKQ